MVKQEITIFQKLYSSSNEIKVIEAFVEFIYVDISVKDIVRDKRVPVDKVIEIIKNLLNYKIIKKTKKLQYTQYYRMTNEKLSKLLQKLFIETIRHKVNDYLPKKKKFSRNR
jgi:predicted methyltransferase